MHKRIMRRFSRLGIAAAVLVLRPGGRLFFDDPEQRAKYRARVNAPDDPNKPGSCRCGPFAGRSQ